MKQKNKKQKPAADKHADFLRVVTPRVKKALKAIGLIGNQAGAAYAPTVEEVILMFKAIRKKVDETEKQYLGKAVQGGDFSFDKEE